MHDGAHGGMSANIISLEIYFSLFTIFYFFCLNLCLIIYSLNLECLFLLYIVCSNNLLCFQGVHYISKKFHHNLPSHGYSSTLKLKFKVHVTFLCCQLIGYSWWLHFHLFIVSIA